MSERTYLLGLDIGGTAVKVALFDLAGRMVGRYEHEIPVSAPHPGWAEIEPSHWRAALQRGARAVLDQGGVTPDRVAGIGLSNMIGTVAPLDAHGEPLRPAIAYFDTRSAEEAAWMLAQAPDIPRLTANRVMAGNTSLTSILWLRRHEPEIYARTATFAQTNTLLFAWLTRERRVDWTNASFMGLFDYRAMDWRTDLADKLEFDTSRLAPIYAPHSTAPLTADAAEALGLCAGTPVALGGLDGAMSSLGVGAIQVGDAYDVSGTSEMIAVCLPDPVASAELLARWHVAPKLWTLIGAISTAGAALQWFRDAVYAPGSASDSQALYETMTAEAVVSPPGANGVVFLPHLAGERAPIWDPRARGVFYGLSLGAKRGDLIRAIMEGVAYAMRHLIELIEARSGVRVARVVTVGGAARNRLWRQIKADVWGVELVASSIPDASALGAALTAGVGAGIYGSYQDAVQRAVPQTGEVTMPDPATRPVYDRAYRIYRQLYPALRDTMRLAGEPEAGAGK